MNKEKYEEYPVSDRYQIKRYIKKISDKIKGEFEDLPDRYHPASLGKKDSELLYKLIRETRPRMIVETGVCNGLSTAVILKALEDNSQGRLYSIDLPVKIKKDDNSNERKGAVIPSNKSSGWAVPEDLKSNWTLILGDTFQETPKLFEKEPSIDMFIHDSDHSYEGMMFEFSLAWRHLNKDGFLLADNIDRNRAFEHFAEGKSLKKYRLEDMGLLKKE